jgi:hypothetical protein
MMHKFFYSIIIAGMSLFYLTDAPKVSTTSVVCLVGAHIKAKETPIVTKYKRQDCPVCKGKGWYISGDGIEKVECGYCEE